MLINVMLLTLPLQPLYGSSRRLSDRCQEGESSQSV